MRWCPSVWTESLNFFKLNDADCEAVVNWSDKNSGYAIVISSSGASLNVKDLQHLMHCNMDHFF